MRPWTTRTLHVALLAAGVAALGSGTASAAELPGGTPEAPAVPTEIGGALPLALCQPPVPVEGQQTLPCADTTLGLQSANVVKDGGEAIAGTTAGLAGQLASGKALTDPQRVPAMLSSTANQVNKTAALDHERPDAALGVVPANTGIIDKGTLLDGTLRRHQPGEPGFSAGDTQTNLDAVQGQTLKPVGSPTDAIQKLTQTPQTLGRSLPVNTDSVGQNLGGHAQSVAQRGPVSQVVGAVRGIGGQRGRSRMGGAPQLPLGQSGQAPSVGLQQVTDQVGAITNATNGISPPRSANPADSLPVEQVPVVGQLAPQLNTPLQGDNPLQGVGMPVNTGDAALPALGNPSQVLENPAQAIAAPAKAVTSPTRVSTRARDLPTPETALDQSPLSNPTQVLSNPTQALSNPTQALSNPTQALGQLGSAASNPGQAATQVTGLVTGLVGSH